MVNCDCAVVCRILSVLWSTYVYRYPVVSRFGDFSSHRSLRGFGLEKSSKTIPRRVEISDISKSQVKPPIKAPTAFQLFEVFQLKIDLPIYPTKNKQSLSTSIPPPQLLSLTILNSAVFPCLSKDPKARPFT